jgi:8-oxo-dGTP pyrophosphatase MutT (NUDIX family)
MDADGFHRFDLPPRYTLRVNDMLPPFGPELAASVRTHLAAHERLAVALDGRRHAAVAVTLIADDDGAACFLLTRRAPRLSSHAGQWALPGGRVEADESAIEGALRELKEEVGLIASPAAVLGCLDDYPTRSGYVITPVVVWAGEHAILAPDPSEVASVHHVPLAVLEHPDVPHLKTIPESDRPVISIAMIGHNVHAPTAAIVYQLREVGLHGRATRVDHFEQPVFAWR